MKFTRYHRFLGIVLATFLAVVSFATGFFNLGGGRASYYSSHPRPDGRDWYIDLQHGLTESHYYILYQSLGPSIEHARQADVLILGDSRALLSYDWRQLEAFSQQTGVRIFNLGIDGGTGWEFALVLMQRHGLKPKAVILALPEFIGNPVFAPAREAMNSGYFANVKYVLSGEVIWRLKNALDMFCPALLKFFDPANSFKCTYRSTTNGCWFRDGWIDEPHYPIEPAPAPCGKDQQLPGEFMDFLARHGISVLVAHAPGNGYCPGQEERLAQDMGGESISISAHGLTTYDKGHLDNASANLYTARFLEKFVHTRAFERIHKGG